MTRGSTSDGSQRQRKEDDFDEPFLDASLLVYPFPKSTTQTEL